MLFFRSYVESLKYLVTFDDSSMIGTSLVNDRVTELLKARLIVVIIDGRVFNIACGL